MWYFTRAASQMSNFKRVEPPAFRARPPSHARPPLPLGSQIQDWSRHKLECCKAWTEAKQLKRLRLGYQRDPRQAEWWWIFDDSQLLLAEQLQREQYTVIPNFLTDDHASALLADFKVSSEAVRRPGTGAVAATHSSPHQHLCTVLLDHPIAPLYLQHLTCNASPAPRLIPGHPRAGGYVQAGLPRGRGHRHIDGIRDGSRARCLSTASLRTAHTRRSPLAL